MYQVLQRMLAISTGERYHDAAAAAEAMRSVAQIPYEALSHGGRVLEHQPVLRDYRVRSTLGRGRSVWLAEKMSGLGGLVAVRVGRPGASRAALLREIESFTGRDTKIRSVHVVEIRDLDTAVDGVLVLISEYVDGDSLESVLARQRGSGLSALASPTRSAGERERSSRAVRAERGLADHGHAGGAQGPALGGAAVGPQGDHAVQHNIQEDEEGGTEHRGRAHRHPTPFPH